MNTLSKYLKKPLALLAVEIAVILLLHAGLMYWLAEKNVVAVIFAAGDHVPKLTLAIAGAFVVMRLVAVLLLPGIILSRLWTIAFERWRNNKVKPAGEGTTA